MSAYLCYDNSDHLKCLIPIPVHEHYKVINHMHIVVVMTQCIIIVPIVSQCAVYYVYIIWAVDGCKLFGKL